MRAHINFAILRYSTLRCTTFHCSRDSTARHTLQHFTLHDMALHYITLPYLPLHCVTSRHILSRHMKKIARQVPKVVQDFHKWAGSWLSHFEYCFWPTGQLTLPAGVRRLVSQVSQTRIRRLIRYSTRTCTGVPACKLLSLLSLKIAGTWSMSLDLICLCSCRRGPSHKRSVAFLHATAA